MPDKCDAPARKRRAQNYIKGRTPRPIAILAHKLACAEARALAAEANFKTIAQENQELIDKLETVEAALAGERAESEQLQATIRKAHVAMTLASALPGVASEYDFSEAIASTEAALARRAAAIRAKGE